jgi:hypothetical protein
MNNDNNLRQDMSHAYEQYNGIYQHVTKTVFDRFNYFIIASSFLVTAFVTTIIYNNYLSVWLAFVGVFVSFAFFTINYANACYINSLHEIRESILKNNLYEDFKICKNDDLMAIYIKLNNKVKNNDNIGNYFSLFPSKIVKLFKILLGLVNGNFFTYMRDFNDKNYFAYTWILPIIAFTLWAIALISQILYFLTFTNYIK